MILDREQTPESVIVLGSGTSTGVPIIGCKCSVCISKDPLNKRTRASLLLRYAGGQQLIIDTGPDFRAQLLRENISSIDAVLYTHLHADHCHGFDDLRALGFYRKTPIPCYLTADHAQELQTRFHYAFYDTGYLGTKPQVSLTMIPDEGQFDIGGISVDCVRLQHGNVQTSAFRFGSFAYATDFKVFHQSALERWRDKIKLMIASGIHFGEHKAHSTIPETIALFANLGVSTGVISHLSHEVDYVQDQKRLPAHISFAHDGQMFHLDQ